MGKNDCAQSPTHTDLAEAKDLDRRFSEAMTRKDLEAAIACFWDDPSLVVVLDGTVHRGPKEVRAAIKEIFDRNKSVKVEVNEITYLPSGDGVIGVGTATFDLEPPSGPRTLMVERWSDLRRKIHGRWVYVLDHTTGVPK